MNKITIEFTEDQINVLGAMLADEINNIEERLFIFDKKSIAKEKAFLRRLEDKLAKAKTV